MPTDFLLGLYEYTSCQHDSPDRCDLAAPAHKPETKCSVRDIVGHIWCWVYVLGLARQTFSLLANIARPRNVQCLLYCVLSRLWIEQFDAAELAPRSALVRARFSFDHSARHYFNSCCCAEITTN